MSKNLRAFRVEDELWADALEKAVAEGRTLSDVIREALEAYVRGSKKS